MTTTLNQNSNTPCFIVDAFTDKPFRGNPAAVVVLKHNRPDDWLQSVAAEFNLSETAFLLKRTDTDWALRWFTPTVEIELCGHATLASAFALLTEGFSSSEQLTFHTLSGELYVSKVANSDRFTLDFPIVPITQCDADDTLLNTLNIAPTECYLAGHRQLFVLPYQQQVAAITPNFEQLKKFGPVVVTAPSDEPGIDFVSRFFAPSQGINEDPVTGSAHCALASYWREQLGKNALTARQISARGGDLELQVDGSRVKISGAANLIMRGQMAI